MRMRALSALFTISLAVLSSVANAENEGLFSDAGDALLFEAPISPDVPSFQRRIVRMDLGQLETARMEVMAGRPAHLALNLVDEVSFRAIVERTAPTSSGYSLSGKLEDTPFGTMALVLNDGVVMGKVRTLDGVYSIRSAGAGTYMIQRAQPIEFIEAPPLRPLPPTSDVASRTDAMATEQDDGSEIDVFVLWTSAAKEVFGGARHVRASIDLAVVETNDAFAASGTAQRIRLVGAVETDYDEPGLIEIQLARLVSPGDGYLDEAHTLRDSYAADLVHVSLGGYCNEFGAAGIAYVMDNPSPSFESSAFSVSVFCDDFLDGRGLSSRVFAHELGHNMGLQHDRYARFTTLNKPYPYSHGYVNQNAFEDGTTDRAQWRTIMSYNDQCADAGFNCHQLLRFSNPTQRYNGHPLGIPGDDPSEEVDGPADAVRSLDETGRIVANFRPSVSRCTYRLAQEAVTVPAAGGLFSLAVEAGPGCAYMVRSHDEFLSVTSDSSDSGDGKVEYKVAANGGDARVGSISVAGETLLVRQSGIHARVSVCGRTPEIRNAIIAWAGRDHCSQVTEFDLSEIPYLILSRRGMTALREGDFAGLSSLYWLSLGGNSITGAIPPELGRLANLRVLGLAGNRLSGSIPPELGQLTSVTLLNLSGNQLTGSIPREIGGLANLRQLDLSDNMLTGSIPVALGRLKEVVNLDLSDNMLTGNIPSELSSLEDLNDLDLSGNRLRGPIPDGFSSLPFLRRIYLHDNLLTGTVPPDLGAAQKLSRLRLHNNRLTGAFPGELSLATNLRTLHLAGNSLTGCIPGTLRDVADNDLDRLGLGYCAAVSIAEGGYASAPPEVGRVTEGTAAALTVLADPPQDMAFNVIVAVSGGEAFGVVRGNRTVTIPSGTTETTLFVNTEDDDVEEPDGALTATILADTGFALMTSRSSASIIIDDDEGLSAPTIVSLAPQEGMLTVTWTAPLGGSISISEYHIRYRPAYPTPGWQTWTRMSHETGRVLQRDITGLTNRVEYDVQVRAVSADGDGSWSEIARGTPRACPDYIELGDCRTLLAVGDTLVGSGTAVNWAIGLPIQEWTGIAVNFFTGRVLELRLADQGLSGTIPAELGSLTELTVLSLSDNGLTGTIPPQLGTLTRLQQLSLSNNRLAGTIPAELGRLSSLSDLFLSDNDLTGTIPSELGSLANLQRLLLGDNDLTGPVPPELSGLANLDALWLQGNELTGSIPAVMGRLAKLRQLLLYSNQLTGSIPTELSRLTNLTELRLSENQLEGSIPGSLRNLTNLQNLFLAGNQLTGCVPAPLRDVEGNDLHLLDLPDCPAASVIDLVIESSPLDGRAYGAGERIEASVWFENDITVSGSPQLALMIGSGVRAATLIANRGSGGLSFRYVVGPADRDSDGISIAPDALALNGGRIRDVDGEDIVLDLGEHAITNDPFHQVRGALRELVPDQALEANGETLTLDLSRYFNIPEGRTLTYGTPASSDPTVATAIIEDGLLKIMPLEGGVTTITVTATDHNGVTVTLSFRVMVTATMGGLRPWLMGILAEQEAGGTEEVEANNPQ